MEMVKWAFFVLFLILSKRMVYCVMVERGTY